MDTKQFHKRMNQLLYNHLSDIVEVRVTILDYSGASRVYILYSKHESMDEIKRIVTKHVPLDETEYIKDIEIILLVDNETYEENEG